MIESRVNRSIMNYKEFDQYFLNYIEPTLKLVMDNNPKINCIYKNTSDVCKVLYKNYTTLNRSYKHAMYRFDKDKNANSNEYKTEADCRLDRHKVASCLCGAVLLSDFFRLDYLDKGKYPVYFYYPNEIFAFGVAVECLKTFILSDDYIVENEDNGKFVREKFPLFPLNEHDKTSFLVCFLFNLSEVGANYEVFDKGSYAMIFFFLEKYFKEIYMEELGIEREQMDRTESVS